MLRSLTLVVAAAVMASACASEPAQPPGSADNGSVSTTRISATTSSSVAGDEGEAGCADVIAVDVTEGDDRFTVAATVRSVESGWDKYADRWEVRDGTGIVLGVRELAHPHENEQPFTRSLTGLEVPSSVTEILVIAHDSVLGFCGESMTVPVPGR